MIRTIASVLLGGLCVLAGTTIEQASAQDK